VSTALSGLSVSPQPGTPDASPKTQLSFLGVPESQLMAVTATGSRSGSHRGTMEPYAASSGASFLPNRPFKAGETVTVHLTRSGFPGLSYRFTIARTRRVTIPALATPKPAPSGPERFFSQPGLTPAPVTVTTDSPGTAPGDLFIGTDRAPGQSDLRVGSPGPEILDNQGSPIWFHQLSGGLAAYDFRPQTYDGQSVLTWWEGDVLSLGYGQGEDVIVNHAYHEVARVRAGNGYFADLHEFQLTPQGTALITVYKPVLADLRSVGGPRDALMVDSIVQEVDVKTGLVMFEWHALGHVPLTASHATPGGPYPFDFFHINSIQLLPNHNLLISARNTWAAYQISTQTGGVVWELGGKTSTFKMGPGTNFAYQHDARQQPDGTISLFDDEDNPKQAPESRGLVLSVNPTARTATVARQYTHPTPLLANSQGNTQLLPNGDALIGWGAEPYFTEFSPTGQVLFDAHLPSSTDTYRAFRAVWSGTPTDPPAVAARTAGSGVKVYASWNGATGVTAWEVLAGPKVRSLRPSARAARTGFETTISLKSGDRYFAVEALDAKGRTLATSKTAKLGGPSTAGPVTPSPPERRLVNRLKTGGTQPNFVAPKVVPTRHHPLRYIAGAIVVLVIAAAGGAYVYRRRRKT
jgi:Arylsulfotransferase (ASST)